MKRGTYITERGIEVFGAHSVIVYDFRLPFWLENYVNDLIAIDKFLDEQRKRRGDE